MTETQPEDPRTACINQKPLAQFVLCHTKASNETPWEILAPEAVDQTDLLDGLNVGNVEEVDSTGDGVEVQGRFHVQEPVDFIPASGGGRLEPPTNPPEVITEEREARFVVRFRFEDEGVVECAEIEVH